MKSVELFDETLDINSTENYELALQSGPAGVQFCLLDTLRNKFVLIRTYEPEEGKIFSADNIREYINRDDFLKKPFRKTRILYPSHRFTIVPAPLFDPSKKEELLTFNHGKEDGSIVLSNKTDDPDAFLVWSIPSGMYEVLTENFGGIHPFIHLVPLLSNMSHSRRGRHGSHVHAHIENDFFNLVIYINNQLSLCNSYSYKNPNDILFFIMNAYSRLGMSQEGTIHVSGHIRTVDPLASELSAYIREVKFDNPHGSFTFSYVFEDIGIHRFINLFSVFNCG